MKSFLAFLLAVSMTAVGFYALEAVAGGGHVWRSAMTSTDAGPTNAVNLPGRFTSTIECTNEATYKLCTSSSCTPVNGTDKRLTCQLGQNLLTLAASCTRYAVEFENGGYTYVAAIAADAGNPACNIYTNVKNP